MAAKTNPAFEKRKKEMNRQRKQQDKEAERAARRDEKASGKVSKDGEDPDLAGIVPGPQPRQE